MNDNPARTLPESASYAHDRAQLIRELGIDERVLDDALEAMTFVIARMPMAGKLTGSRGIRALPVNAYADVPPLTIFYAQHKHNRVMLIGLRRAATEDFEL